MPHPHYAKSEPIIFDSKVLKIIEKNKYQTGKTKTVFEAETPKKNTLTCIDWNNPNIKEGDEIELKGTKNADVFLVWSLMITKRATEEENL